MKHIKNITLPVLIVQLFITTQSHAQTAHERWASMQENYNRINRALTVSGDMQKDQQYCHPHWQQNKEQLKQLILGPTNEDFASNPQISSNMIRRGWTPVQQYEVCYLKNCLSEKTQEMIKRTQDTSFLGLPRECQEFNCSTNTLAQLYYAAKTLELSNNNLSSIVEFGGGYGNLARMYKEMLPEVTYFIIDLPELLAIQHFFLQSTLPGVDVQMHAQIPSEFKKGSIHLIPAYIAEGMNIKTDLFVSAFAITESSEIMQNIVANKRFFDASICYVVGQLVGCNHPWVHHSVLQSSIRKSYIVAECRPSFFFFHGVNAYEMIGLH